MKIRIISNHKLMIKTGRYNQTPHNDRVCTVCNSGIIEDEFHLLRCPKYSIPREKFYNQIRKKKLSILISYLRTELIIKLMNSKNFSVTHDLRNNLRSNHTEQDWD